MELGLDSWTNYIAPRKLGLYTMEKVSDKLCAKGRKQTWEGTKFDAVQVLQHFP